MSENRNRPPKRETSKPRNVAVKPANYQPSVEELNEEHDMPGMSDPQIRDAFFRPINFVVKD